MLKGFFRKGNRNACIPSAIGSALGGFIGQLIREQEEDADHMANTCNMEAEAHMQGVLEPLDFNHFFYLKLNIYITNHLRKQRDLKHGLGADSGSSLIQYSESLTHGTLPKQARLMMI